MVVEGRNRNGEWLPVCVGLLQCWKCHKIRLWWQLYVSVNILKPIELYALSWWIVWYMNTNWKSCKNVSTALGIFILIEVTKLSTVSTVLSIRGMASGCILPLKVCPDQVDDILWTPVETEVVIITVLSTWSCCGATVGLLNACGM